MGFEFVSSSPGVNFDINIDGVGDTIGWMSGSDNAFLVLLAGPAQNLCYLQMVN